MVAFWQIVWLLIAVQMAIGLIMTQLYYDDTTAKGGRTAEEDPAEGTLHG